jgi:ATP-dependent protease ClpP protease subunit
MRFSIKALADDIVPAGEVTVYGEIGDDDSGVDLKEFDRQLKALGDIKQLILRINSIGGDAFQGIAMHNVLARHPANITCYIEAFAASAASLIAMAADKIVCPENGLMVVHNPMGATIGDGDAHRSMAADLDSLRDQYAETYAKRSGQPLAAVKSLMSENRVMKADEAKAKGYVDEVVPPAHLVAAFNLDKLPAPLAKHRDSFIAALSPLSLQPGFSATAVAGWRAAQDRVRAESGVGRKAARAR